MRRFINVLSLRCVQRISILATALSLGLISATSQEDDSRNNTNKLATSVDLQARFSDSGLQQRHQGARGTCSIFTMVGAMEFAIARSQGHGANLSVDFLNWAANQHRS